MGILSAINKSVGGLNAQSFALENISGNIANSQTTAYKRTDTSFEDLIGAGTNRVSLIAAGNVRATARSTVGIQGAIEGSTIETYMGVQGSGFFTVLQKAGETDGQTVFNTGQAYTRRGDFQVNKEGYLVNGAGYFLAGLSIDSTTNNPVGDTPSVIKIDKSPIAAESTSEITYKINLPEDPKTTHYLATTNPTASDYLWDDTGLATAGEVTWGDEADSFEQNSISGGAVTAYDSNGTPVNVQIRWAKTADGDPSTWKAFYLSNSDETSSTPKWTQLGGDGQDFQFNADGTLTSGSLTDNALTLSSGITIDGNTVPESGGSLTFNFGDGGITQNADSSGQATVRQLTQDGSPVGNFIDISVSDGGRIVANYTNGKTVDLFQIPLVSFSGESSLKPLDGGAYAETKESGPAINDASGQVVGASLEHSNVDIGEEFTKLIVTQQAFSANSKVITTADQMMTDVLNTIR